MKLALSFLIFFSTTAFSVACENIDELIHLTEDAIAQVSPEKSARRLSHGLHKPSIKSSFEDLLFFSNDEFPRHFEGIKRGVISIDNCENPEFKQQRNIKEICLRHKIEEMEAIIFEIQRECAEETLL